METTPTSSVGTEEHFFVLFFSKLEVKNYEIHPLGVCSMHSRWAVTPLQVITHINTHVLTPSGQFQAANPLTGMVLEL